MFKKTAALVIVLGLAIALSAGDKEKPKRGSIVFGSKTRLTSDIARAKATSRAFIDVAKFVKPSVVSVASAKIMKVPDNLYGGSPFDFFFGMPQPPQPGRPAPEKEFRQEGLGSGVIVGTEGYVLTNNHVVEGADEIIVTIDDTREIEAEVIGTDKEADIAVLKLKENVSGLPVAVLGNSDSVEVGEWVLAVGNPFSKKLSHTVTAGIVSAVGRNAGINSYENFIQTDASINPGNSGGALVNLQGEVIGINTAIMSRSGGNIGIGFAIPINMARKVMEDLIYSGKVSRGWLGIEMQPIEKNLGEALGLKDNNGVLAKKVLKDSPADKAGLKSGDVILEANRTRINNPDELKNLIGNLAPNTKLDLRIVRDKKEKVVTVTLGERTPETLAGGVSVEETEEDLVGIKVRGLSPELAQQYELDADDKGALITSVKPRSSAAAADLHEGDLIQQVNNREVSSPSDYQAAIKGLKPGQSVLFYIKRGKSNLYVGLKVKDKETETKK
ncbi:MAG: Do family serine endopeptidase [Fibrobacterota bacterium]